MIPIGWHCAKRARAAAVGMSHRSIPARLLGCFFPLDRCPGSAALVGVQPVPIPQPFIAPVPPLCRPFTAGRSIPRPSDAADRPLRSRRDMDVPARDDRDTSTPFHGAGPQRTFPSRPPYLQDKMTK